MGAEPLLDALRSTLQQEASIPGLRALLFLCGMCGAFAWFRRAPRIAFSLIMTGSLVGLSYWLIQIRTPFGFGTDPELTRQWAQAGVNGAAGTGGAGFVWGTDEERSWIGTLATAGVPMPLVFLIPQMNTLLSLVLVALLPLNLIRNRMTAGFAASLAAGGGLWPGISQHGAFLLRPGLLAVVFAAWASAILLARSIRFRRAFGRSRSGVAAVLIVLAALHRGIWGGSESEAFAPLALITASAMLASPLRVFLRRATPTRERARAFEAALLLAAFAGSGLFWFNPAATLEGFSEARGHGGALRRPLLWIARNVPAGDVVLASAPYSAAIAAFGGRRVLFPIGGDEARTGPLTEPFRRERLRESTLRGQPAERLATAFSVTHLLLGPGEPTPPAGESAGGPEDLRLVLVYEDAEDFRLFRLAKK